MTRRLLPLAVLTTTLALASACSEARTLYDKAAACGEALGLASLTPDPQKAKQEAAEKAERLHKLAQNTSDGDVKGALETLATEYVEVSKRNVREIETTANWAAEVARTQENVRQVCL